MRRSMIVLGVAFLLLFGAVALWKKDPGQNGPDQEAVQQATDERAQVRAFWQRYREATAYRLAGRRAAALEAYQQALELDAQHEDALYYLGNVHLELGERAEAERAWKRLAAINPRSSRAHLRLGDLYLCHVATPWFDLDAAEAAYRRAWTINREETGPLLRLGQVALLRGELEAAARHFDDVLASNRQSVAAHLLSGYVAWTTNDRAQATARYDRAIEHADAKMTSPAAGEGATATGKALISATSGCAAFEPYVDAPREQESADQRYRALQAFLDSVRTRVATDSR